MELNTYLKMGYNFKFEEDKREVICDLSAVLKELNSLFKYVDNFEDLEDYIQWSYGHFDDFLWAFAANPEDTIAKIVELVNEWL